MKNLLFNNFEIKTLATFMVGIVEVRGLPYLAIGFVLGHIISPHLRKLYVRKTKTQCHRKSN